MDNINFIKMHGLGNDFVILDSRLGSITLQPKEISLIADRHIGVGCDQIVIMLPSQDDLADIFIKIFNSDGSETFACGNATRCVASELGHGSTPTTGWLPSASSAGGCPWWESPRR